MIFRFVESEKPDAIKLNFSDILKEPEHEDMKITPTKVVLQCQICKNPTREFNYFHALKGHFESLHGGSEDMNFKKRVIKGMAFNFIVF